MYFTTGTLFVKLSGIFMSLFGFGKMVSRRKCKVSTANDLGISLKLQNARKLSLSDPEVHRRRPGTIESISSPKTDVSVVEQANHDHQKALSLKELSHEIEFEECDIVPDPVEYQIPFGCEIEEIPMNDRVNGLEKQLVCLRQQLEEEQDEIRKEIKSLAERFRECFEKIENKINN